MNADARSVLVVDDEILLRYLIAEQFRERGYTVLEAVDAQEALSILESGTVVQAVFTDVLMPWPIDGVALARIIATKWPSVPVVLTSGTPDRVDDRRGVAAFFLKPYDLQKVVEHIGALIDARPSCPPDQADSVA